jgi:UDP-glucose 4-epimerase
MRCLILGGGGFIGSHLRQGLLACGYEVAVLDRPDARYLDLPGETHTQVFTGDFSNPAEAAPALEGCEVVFHLVSATVPQTSNENPSLDIQANVLGTLRLLEAARSAGVKRVVFASSGGTVYGIPQELPIKEGHPTNPTTSYGISKLAIEKYLHLFWSSFGIDYRILRISNAYGIRQPVTPTQGVIAAFLDKALQHEELVIWGDGSVMRDYIYVSDIVDALIKAAAHEGEYKIFNIGAGQGHSLLDIISSIEQVTQQSLQVKYLPGRPFDVPVNVLDIARADLQLDWRPAVALPEGISRTYKWMMAERLSRKD